MKTLLHCAFLLVTMGFIVAPATAFANTCNVYAFGDSLSDIGVDSPYSAYTQSGGQEPPSTPPVTKPNPGDTLMPPDGFYADGRFSDGRIWIQYLASSLCPGGSLTSFARGGAFSDDRNANEDLGVVGGLRSQVFEDLNDVLKPGTEFGANDFVTVWAFSNNVVFDLLMVNPVQAIQNVIEAVQELSARGAKNILVLNTPAIGDTPYGQLLAQQVFPGLPNNLNARVGQFNNMLRTAIAGLDQTLDASVVLLDVDILFRAILKNPDMYEFKNAELPCMIQDESRNRVLTGACPVFPKPDGSFALNASGTVFYDLLHPTNAVHRLINAAALGALGSTALPSTISAQ